MTLTLPLSQREREEEEVACNAHSHTGYGRLHWHCYSPRSWWHAAARKMVGPGMVAQERMSAISPRSSNPIVKFFAPPPHLERLEAWGQHHPVQKILLSCGSLLVTCYHASAP